ncbi:hypothetical protein ADL26_09210 [Thermoactinomyces vulgaris]|jgi:hypothetical protein|nr:hypothetical protein ADL26_09210 [Thermoactinomyces vulgaris]TCW37823.1 hypothetical protein EDC32_103494 [Laceyella sacchari]
MQHTQALKAFADWMNQLVGKPFMDESQLEQFMFKAMERYQKHGIPGFIEYISQVVHMPISQEAMMGLMKQMMTPEGMREILGQLNMTPPAQVNELMLKRKQKQPRRDR